MTPETAARLEGLIDRDRRGGRHRDLVPHDLEFHQTIVEASGNEYLSRLVESMSSATVRARIWRGITQQGATDRTIAEHRGILDALRRGDSRLAEALMLTHIAGIEDWLRDASSTRG